MSNKSIFGLVCIIKFEALLRQRKFFQQRTLKFSLIYTQIIHVSQYLILVLTHIFLMFWCLVMLNNFSYTCWPFVCFLWVPLLTFNCVVGGGVVCYWVVWVFNIFWILTTYQIYSIEIFSLISRLPFHFVDGFFCCAEHSSLTYFHLMSVLLIPEHNDTCK